MGNPLMFTGKEEDYDIWETRFLGYMSIKDLKKTKLPSTSEAGKNEKSYVELVMLLDETSLSTLFMGIYFCTTKAVLIELIWNGTRSI